jgi:hypothetical protein
VSGDLLGGRMGISGLTTGELVIMLGVYWTEMHWSKCGSTLSQIYVISLHEWKYGEGCMENRWKHKQMDND